MTLPGTLPGYGVAMVVVSLCVAAGFRAVADSGIVANLAGMVFLVAYKFGTTKTHVPQGSAIQFPMTSATPKAILALELGFDPDDGTGVYAVRIKGDKSDETFDDNFDGKSGVDPLILPFEFTVLP